MKTPDFSSNKTSPDEIPPRPRARIPRIESLHHRLRRAKGADGQPLLDELLFFLDDPPAGTGDRWEAGAELCRRHGLVTSRMAVWRFYRAHILPWRREQNPVPEPPSDPKEIARLYDQARSLAAQRLLEFLQDPRLTSSQLIGLMQNENCRLHYQLARDRFDDQLLVRTRLERHHLFQVRDRIARDKQVEIARQKLVKNFLAEMEEVPPHTTS